MNLIPIKTNTNPARVLWVTPRWPIPESDGARVATAQSLRTLGAAPGKFEVSVLAILPSEDFSKARPDDLKEHWGVQEVRCVRRADRLWGSRWLSLVERLFFHSSKAITFLPLGSRKVRQEAQDWVQRGNFDVLVFDGLHGAMIFEHHGGVRLPKMPVIYRAHNVESDLWRITAERQRNWLLKKVLEAQHYWVERFERSLVKSCAQVLSVSEEDQAQFKNRMSPNRTRVYRIGADFGESGPPARSLGNDLVLGFIGKLDWRPNREGLSWLLQEVWPVAKRLRPELKLKIAGSGKLGISLPTGTESGVEFLGYVPKLSEFYSEIDALLVPIFTGSGTRVKAIEASQYARACIGTTLGLSGVSMSSSIIADTRDAWIEILVCVLAKDLAYKGQSAWFSARERFDASVCGDVLIQALLEATGRPSGILS